MVDYMAVTPSLKSIVRWFKVLPHEHISDHSPLLCKLSVKASITSSETVEKLYRDAPAKPKWNDELSSREFDENLNRADVTASFIEIANHPLEDEDSIYSVNEKFVNILTSALGNDQPTSPSEQSARTFSKKKRR